MATTIKDEVSVITTSMNYGRYIGDCIESVLGQKTDFPFKMNHIIVDGGSTDDTAEIVKKYGDKVHFYVNEGEGQTPALNHAMQVIEEKFPKTNMVGWINADDYYQPNWLQSSISVLRNTPLTTGMTCGNYNQDGVPLHLREKVARMESARSRQPAVSYVNINTMTRGNVICQPTVLLRMSSLKAVKDKYGFYFDPKYDYTQDVDLWNRFLLSGYNIAKISDVVSNLRRHPLRMSRSHREDQRREGNRARRWLKKESEKGVTGLKIAFVWGVKSSYSHDGFWENKFDSMQFAISHLTTDHDVRIFASEENIRPRQIINGQDFTFYKHGDERSLIKNLSAFNPNMIFLNVLNDPLWRSVVDAFPMAWKSVMDYGSIALRVPLADQLDVILVQQEYQKSILLLKNNVSADKVRVNTFCIRQDLFKPILGEKPYVGIMVGDFRWKIKRQHLLIKAWKYIPGKLLLVGRFDRSMPENYYNDLVKLTKALGIEDRVEFMDSVPSSEMPALINKAKIGYMTSFREGGSRAQLEKMACGLPVIVMRRCQGTVNLMRPGVEGLIAEPEPKDIAAKTLELLENYREMGEAASKRVRRQYPYRRMLVFYRELIEEYQKGGKMS